MSFSRKVNLKPTHSTVVNVKKKKKMASQEDTVNTDCTDCMDDMLYTIQNNVKRFKFHYTETWAAYEIT